MFKTTAILFLGLFFFVSGGRAQTEKVSVPVKWEKYQVGERDVAVLLPKLPVMIENNDWCSEQTNRQFAAYADQTIYGLTITAKSKEKAPAWCSRKKSFSEQNFESRTAQVREQLKDFTETSLDQNNKNVRKIAGTNTVYWLVNDFENKRWFELWTIGKTEKPEVENFIASIEIGKNLKGIEIGNGAPRTLGDETIKTDDSQKGTTTPFIIGVKPRPAYTEAARQAQAQGVVRLKVTFLASGAIGSVTPVAELTHGLTEQAVNAARRIVFIPQSKDGVPVSVTKIIEYSFAIY